MVLINFAKIEGCKSKMRQPLPFRFKPVESVEINAIQIFTKTGNYKVRFESRDKRDEIVEAIEYLHNDVHIQEKLSSIL